MKNTAAIVYFITFFINVVIIGLYLPRFSKQHGIHYITFFIVSAGANLNYIFLFSATNSESALYAQIGVYACSLFIPIIFLCILCDICNARKVLIQRLAIPLGIILMLAIGTTERTGLFYRSFEIDPTTHIIAKEYGPFHTVYYAYVFLCYFLTGFIIAANRKKRGISKRSVSGIVAMEVVLFISVFLGDMLGIRFDFDGIFDLVISIGLFLLSRRIPLYDVDSSLTEKVERDHDLAIATFDTKGRVLGFNNAMSELVHDFEKCEIDSPIPDAFSQRDLVFEMQKEFDTKNVAVKREVFTNDKWYEVELSSLSSLNKNCGYQIIARDITEKNKYINLLEQYRNELIGDVKKKLTQINALQDATILGVAELIESRDGTTGGHVKRTSEVVKILSRYLVENKVYDVPSYFYAILEKVAPLHDVGKIAVDDVILRKPGRFNDEEYAQMKKHAPNGGMIVTKILTGIDNATWTSIGYNVANSHHERWDGRGYPNQLAGDDIPIEARIMAVADVYDALATKRSYKDAFDFDTIHNIISDEMGKQFDPALYDCFIACEPQMKAYYENIAQKTAN